MQLDKEWDADKNTGQESGNETGFAAAEDIVKADNNFPIEEVVAAKHSDVTTKKAKRIYKCVDNGYVLLVCPVCNFDKFFDLNDLSNHINNSHGIECSNEEDIIMVYNAF
eukprot:Pgem_evm1s8462